MARIDRKLNLVIEIDRDDGPLYVHSTPIRIEIFRKYYLPISNCFAEMWSQGPSYIIASAPRVASLALRQTAENLGVWEGDEGVENGLMREIRRLTNVTSPGPNGWDVLPMEMAISRGLMTDQEMLEVENAIVFFTVASCMVRAKDLAELSSRIGVWGLQTTLLNATEYTASLQTLKPSDNTGESPIPAVALPPH